MGTGDQRPGGQLTRREQEILEHLALGLSNREIASHLDISLSTVRCHLHSAYLKLGVRNRAEAVARSLGAQRRE